MLKQLASVILAVFLSMPASWAIAADSDCSKLQLQTTGCPTVTAEIVPEEVRLEGIDVPGQTSPRTDPSNDPGTETSANTDLDGSQPGFLAECTDPLSPTCIRPYIATITAPVTLADIAAFRPTPAVDHMEPNGWSIVGLATNFYATGGAHIEDGTLLGQPASVRFTPVEWHWSYGDGAAASHPYPGASWAAQGVREFEPTPTSHIYERYGTYYVDLDVDFAAEYRFAGGPWVQISGTLTVPANRLVIAVGSVKTVLVERECTRKPDGPGC